MIRLYGIPNCDTVRKARRWLADRSVAFEFHDLRNDGLSPELLLAWVAEMGWEALLNRRGATWRKLPEDVRNDLDEESAVQLMLENPVIIKRPVVEADGKLLVGFSADSYQKMLM